MVEDLALYLDEKLELHVTDSHRYRGRQTAIGVPTAVWLWTWIKTFRPRSILELGTGFSTYVIRECLAHYDIPCSVYSVDLTSRWNKVTWAECERLGLSADIFMHYAAFKQKKREPFDLVFLDVEDTKTRLKMVNEVVGWVAENGTLVLDDYHMEHYGPRIKVLLETHGFFVTPHQSTTTDEFGRYIATARRTAPYIDA
jgi:predicted O-methyltransferase YrrM